jgi:hypothetical protein
MTICELAAAESALYRAWDEAIYCVRDSRVNLVVGVPEPAPEPLRVVEGSRPALAPPGSAHPSLRAARNRRE